LEQVSRSSAGEGEVCARRVRLCYVMCCVSCVVLFVGVLCSCSIVCVCVHRLWHSALFRVYSCFVWFAVLAAYAYMHIMIMMSYIICIKKYIHVYIRHTININIIIIIYDG
jgi:hypothetical protein